MKLLWNSYEIGNEITWKTYERYMKTSPQSMKYLDNYMNEIDITS